MVSDQLWLQWSDTLGRYAPTWPSYGEAVPLSDCKILNRADINAKDWRPVRIPTPCQIEATADLLAACQKLLAIAGELPPETEAEQSAMDVLILEAKAAIAKANGESAKDAKTPFPD